MTKTELVQNQPIETVLLHVLAIRIMTGAKQRTLRELWWKKANAQRVWIEITRRPNDDIGEDLRHNTRQVLNLLGIARKGDKVIHWDSKRGCFVGVSTVRDTQPRKMGGDMGLLLSGFIQFPKEVLTLEQIRGQWRLFKEIHDEEYVQGQALYFPFAPYGSKKWKSLRPRLAYLAIAPPKLVSVLGAIYKQQTDPELFESWESFGFPMAPLPRLANSQTKPKYTPANEKQGASSATWLSSNEALAKSTVKHHELQNLLAAWLKKNGFEPDSTRAMDKLVVDIKWQNKNTLCVCEVKTLGKDESSQLRLGLGQILSYRFETKRIENLKLGTRVKAVLAIDRKPSTEILKLWEPLCHELNVLLVWPGTFQKIKKFMS
jgi:hypothetical protein